MSYMQVSDNSPVLVAQEPRSTIDELLDFIVSFFYAQSVYSYFIEDSKKYHPLLHASAALTAFALPVFTFGSPIAAYFIPTQWNIIYKLLLGSTGSFMLKSLKDYFTGKVHARRQDLRMQIIVDRAVTKQTDPLHKKIKEQDVKIKAQDVKIKAQDVKIKSLQSKVRYQGIAVGKLQSKSATLQYSLQRHEEKLFADERYESDCLIRILQSDDE